MIDETLEELGNMSFEKALRIVRSVRKLEKDAEPESVTASGPVKFAKSLEADPHRNDAEKAQLAHDAANLQLTKLYDGLRSQLAALDRGAMHPGARATKREVIIADFLLRAGVHAPYLIRDAPETEKWRMIIEQYGGKFEPSAITKADLAKLESASATATAALDVMAKEHAAKSGKSYHAAYAAVAHANPRLLWLALKESGPVGSMDNRVAKARWA